jgi:hypothetical protein
LATDGRGYEGPGAGSEAEPSPGLSAFGYRPSLHRLLRSLSLHALTFSSLGVLLGSVLLIGPYWAAARGGAIWAYAAGALVCQTLIALVFAELVAEYPEVYAKLSLKKYRPMAARNEDKKVFSGLL